MLRYIIKLFFPFFPQESFPSRVCLLDFWFIVSSDNLHYTTILEKHEMELKLMFSLIFFSLLDLLFLCLVAVLPGFLCHRC